MAVKLIQHIELRGQNPRHAVLVGSNLKAYLVAQFVLGWGVEAAMEQYGLNQGMIYAAMSFYYDNLPALQAQFEQDQAETNQNATEDKEKTEPRRRALGHKG